MGIPASNRRNFAKLKLQKVTTEVTITLIYLWRKVKYNEYNHIMYVTISASHVPQREKSFEIPSKSTHEKQPTSDYEGYLKWNLDAKDSQAFNGMCCFKVC